MCSVDSDRVLFELADEVGIYWKQVAMDVDFRIHEIDVIEKEARTPKEQACKMLYQFRSKIGHSNFSSDKIRSRLRKIKQKEYDAELKSTIWKFSVASV